MVFNDAVVHHADLARRVRMRIHFAGHAVRGPARMRDAAETIQAGLFLQGVQVADLALRAQAFDAMVGEHRDTGRVIAPIFQGLQAGDQVVDDGALGADADDSAHGDDSFLKTTSLARSATGSALSEWPTGQPADTRAASGRRENFNKFNTLTLGTVPAEEAPENPGAPPRHDPRYLRDQDRKSTRLNSSHSQISYA